MGKTTLKTFNEDIDESLLELCLESWNSRSSKYLYFNTNTLKFEISDKALNEDIRLFVARREFIDLPGLDNYIIKDEFNDYYFTGDLDDNVWCFYDPNSDDPLNGLINEPDELYKHYIQGDIEYNDLFKEQKEECREILKYSPVINA